ncbi:unnamed protein product [Peronospora belbahrii]|uniref:Uncharacterized protein n=1 Tax=Peronospora belbahrii TaxID=622444 RepID=A0ABN8D9J2_9STRA|nr:unnamed protein product [Peronospora belbahrii]
MEIYVPFREVCDTVLKYKDAKAGVVAQTLYNLEFCQGSICQPLWMCRSPHLAKQILAPPSGVVATMKLSLAGVLLLHLPPVSSEESLAPMAEPSANGEMVVLCAGMRVFALEPRFLAILAAHQVSHDEVANVCSTRISEYNTWHSAKNA